MKPFHVNFFEDLPSFIALCKLISQNSPATPVFYADGSGVHFFIGTEIYRAHFETKIMSAEDVANKVKSDGCLHTIRASISHWADESPVFKAPFDTESL